MIGGRVGRTSCEINREAWTRFIEIMMVCWASVVDGGPTLNQHYVNVSCLQERRRQTKQKTDAHWLKHLYDREMNNGQRPSCFLFVGRGLLSIKQGDTAIYLCIAELCYHTALHLTFQWRRSSHHVQNDWMDGWMNEWMNEWMNKWINETMNEWMNE